MRISHKILLVVLPVVIVSILAISIIALNNFAVSTKNEIIDKLKLTGNNIVDKISRVMFERVADIKFLSGSKLLSEPGVSIDQKIDFLNEIYFGIGEQVAAREELYICHSLEHHS